MRQRKPLTSKTDDNTDCLARWQQFYDERKQDWVTEVAQLSWKEGWFGHKYFDESEADLSFLALINLVRVVHLVVYCFTKSSYS